MSNKLKFPKLELIQPLLGSDPEFFLRKKGKIIESTKVIPLSGMSYNQWSYNRVVCDGVQAELHTGPQICREVYSHRIAEVLNYTKNKLNDINVTIDFSGVIKLSDKELRNLSKYSKKFGCAPSKNVYFKDDKIKVDASKYPYRSAGGHIHLSFEEDSCIESLRENPVLVVKLLDIICGNTLVMVDRDPMQIERRKVYGKAGEYRMPKHGIEYRVPSNFWLGSYPLFGLTMGLARQAVLVANAMIEFETNYDKLHPYRVIFDLVNEADIIEAINTNNFDLAKSNFDKIKDVLLKMVPREDGASSFLPITKSNIKEFEYFVNRINKYGLSYWFSNDKLFNWIKCYNSGRWVGWETFSRTEVRKDMKKSAFNSKCTFSSVMNKLLLSD